VIAHGVFSVASNAGDILQWKSISRAGAAGIFVKMLAPLEDTCVGVMRLGTHWTCLSTHSYNAVRSEGGEV